MGEMLYNFTINSTTTDGNQLNYLNGINALEELWNNKITDGPLLTLDNTAGKSDFSRVNNKTGKDGDGDYYDSSKLMYPYSNISIPAYKIIMNPSLFEPMKEEKSFPPIPELIRQNGPATIVHWTDGTKTTVKMCKEDKEANAENNIYTAFCIAFAKKCFGTNSMLHRIVDYCDEENVLERKAKLEKEAKERAARIAEKRRMRRIKKKAKQISELGDAYVYLAKKDLGSIASSMKSKGSSDDEIAKEIDALVKEILGGKK